MKETRLDPEKVAFMIEIFYAVAPHLHQGLLMVRAKERGECPLCVPGPQRTIHVHE